MAKPLKRSQIGARRVLPTKVEVLTYPDPKRPQLWSTKHPWDDNAPRQAAIVYPNGDYEFFHEPKQYWRKQKLSKWTLSENELDMFEGNL